MTDLARLRLEDFKPLIQGTFELDAAEAGRLDLVLVEGDHLPTRQRVPAGGRRSFNLVFRAPKEPRLQQRIYPLTHPDLGTVDLFLVPINEDREGRYYEAVFT